MKWVCLGISRKIWTKFFQIKKNIAKLTKVTTFILGLYIQFIYNMVTFLRRPEFFCPEVTVIQGFDCSKYKLN